MAQAQPKRAQVTAAQALAGAKFTKAQEKPGALTRAPDSSPSRKPQPRKAPPMTAQTAASPATSPAAAPAPATVTPVAIPPAPPRISLTAANGLEAIELYAAADRTIDALSANVWGAFAVLVDSDPDAEQSLGSSEKEFKVKHAGMTLPNSYRSAKSVALTAKKLSLPLLDSAGDALGKTAVQKAIAKAKAEQRAAEHTAENDDGTGEPVAEGKDYLGVFVRSAHNLRRVWDDLTPEQRQTAQDAIDALLS